MQAIASRGHQAICRFYDTYPAQPNVFPDYIRKLTDYEEMTAKSEGGNTGFPDKAFQAQFYQHLDHQFKTLRWNISVDAADPEYSPIESQPDRLTISFGLFDDSFMCKEHPKVNAKN